MPPFAPRPVVLAAALACVAASAACAAGAAPSAPAEAVAPAEAPSAQLRREIEDAYARNTRAFLAKDPDAVMALRTDDFHAITPDGMRHDRKTMEDFTRTFLGSIERWIGLTFTIDSLTPDGNDVSAEVRQHAVRMQLRNDGKVHHVETWVTQRETWSRTPEGWKLRRVDNVRDQRRLVDGKPA